MPSSPAVVVLGAGRGSRYTGARHKLAEPLGNETVLGQTVRQAIGSGLPVVVVTTSALVEAAARHVARRDIVVLGGDAGMAPGGMGDSIAAGVAARPHAGGWLILPADMPLVRSRTLSRVAAAMRQQPVVYAQHQGQRGHPVAFAAELYSDLIRLSGEEGARRLLARYPASGVEVDDPGVLQDMDTETDLAVVRSRWAAQVAAGGVD